MDILHGTRCTCFGQITGGIVAAKEGFATVSAGVTVDARATPTWLTMPKRRR